MRVEVIGGRRSVPGVGSQVDDIPIEARARGALDVTGCDIKIRPSSHHSTVCSAKVACQHRASPTAAAWAIADSLMLVQAPNLDGQATAN
jgi:hypothetical protein